MASLADELDLDPAFADLDLGDRRNVESSQDYDDESVSSSSFSSPQATRRRRTAGQVRRAKSISSNGDDEDRIHATLVSGAGFSLAEELDGGDAITEDSSTDTAARPTVRATLMDEVGDGGYFSIDEKTSGWRTPTNLVATSRRQAFDDDARARRDQEHYLHSSEILNDSVRQTDAFLSKLRKVTDSASAGGATLPSLASATSVTSTNGGIPGVSSSDDTAGIESAAATLIRQLRKHTQTREGQVRELQECDRILRRAFEEGGEYLMAVAEIESAAQEETDSDDAAFEVLAEERDPLGYAIAAKEVMASQRRLRENSLDESVPVLLDGDESAMLAIRFPTAELTTESADETKGESSQPSAFQDLIQLQKSTRQLVGSLGILHEHSQIAGASMGDATRIIRNIRTVLTNWQSEVQSMEQSQAWIASSAANKGPKNIRQWSQDHLGQFSLLLEEAHIKARELLKPVDDPVLDRLIASRA